MGPGKFLTVLGLFVALAGAVVGAVWGTPPYSAVHVGTQESGEKKRKGMRNALRCGLGLIATGTVLQILGTMIAR